MAGVCEPRPFRPGVPKAELREQAAAAMAGYEGPIVKVQAKRRRV
jgi:hypothetical protein